MRLTRSLFTVAACLGLASTFAVHADESWNGGDGTWDFNTTANWNSGTWTTNSQAAIFNSTPGTVTVDDAQGQVGAYYLDFASSGANPWVVTGDAIDLSIAGSGNNLILSQDSGVSNITVDSDLNVNTVLATDRYNLLGHAAGDVAINGDMTFGDQSQGGSTRTLIVGSTSADTNFYLNGKINDSSATGGVPIGLRVAEGVSDLDHVFINGDLSGLSGGMQIGAGTVVVGPSAVLAPGTVTMYDDRGSATDNVELLAAQGATISHDVYISMKYNFDGDGVETPGAGVLGAYDASSVHYTGNVGLDNSGAILTAASDGRATFSGSFGNHSPNGIIKTGAGTVVLAAASGYGINSDFNPSTATSTTAFEVQQGTVLITNPSGSAFGGSSGVVKVDSGTTLGGNGNSSQNVVAMAADAHLSPGDAGQANLGIASSIGTLHLNGGLTATSGLTMDFKLDGLVYDSIDFGGSSFNLDNVVTINLTGTPVISAANDNGTYNILTGLNLNEAIVGNNLDFEFNAPTGYEVVRYGTIAGPLDGMGNDAGQDYFYVQLAATPEPSTYGLIGLGLLTLVAVRRFRRLGV